jgi:hypothetical protein
MLSPLLNFRGESQSKNNILNWYDNLPKVCVAQRSAVRVREGVETANEAPKPRSGNTANPSVERVAQGRELCDALNSERAAGLDDVGMPVPR